MALGFTRLHHRLWNRISKAFTSNILVQTFIVSIFRRVVFFFEIEFGHLLSS